MQQGVLPSLGFPGAIHNLASGAHLPHPALALGLDEGQLAVRNVFGGFRHHMSHAREGRARHDQTTELGHDFLQAGGLLLVNVRGHENLPLLLQGAGGELGAEVTHRFHEPVLIHFARQLPHRAPELLCQRHHHLHDKYCQARVLMKVSEV